MGIIIFTNVDDVAMYSKAAQIFEVIEPPSEKGATV